MVSGFTNLFYNSVTQEYTLFGTLTYSILLIAGIYLIYTKLLKNSKIKIDKTFMLSFVPFIVFGGVARAAADVILLSQVPNYIKFFIVTPGIYFTITFLALATLWISMHFQKRKKIKYNKIMIWTGSILSFATAVWLFQFVSNFRGMFMVLGILGAWAVALYPIAWKFPEYLSKENYWILLSHMFDASATFAALQFHAGLGEKHVLPNLLIFDFALGPWVMFLLKLAIVWPVLYYIDKSSSEKEYKTWLKIVVLLLGLALGMRDIFAIGIFGQPLF